MPALLVRTGPSESRIPLGTEPVVVGRSQECDVPIQEIRASRRHFEVRATERGWVLTDLESSNGTEVNGFGVSRVLLSAGDVIEVGDVSFEFESEESSAPRVPRAPRKPPGTGSRWVAAVVAALSLAVVTDHLAVGAAETRSRAVDAAEARATRAEFQLATRLPDPRHSESALEDFLRAHPAAADAKEAAAALASLRAARAVREEVRLECEALDRLRPVLSGDEFHWRMERLLRRWIEEPAAVSELRRRFETAAAPEAGSLPTGGTAAKFDLRSTEAAAAVARGDFGRAASLWSAHAEETGTGSDDRVRAAALAVEDAAAKTINELFRRADELTREKKPGEVEALLLAALPGLEGTVAGRRLVARLERGELSGRSVPGGAAAGGSSRGGGRSPVPAGEGYERQRSLYLRAREAEQYVALRDYDEAVRRFRTIAGEATGVAEVKEEMDARVADLEAVAALLADLRAAGSGSTSKPLPETWDAILPEDLFHLLDARVARTPEKRLALAAFSWDQGLRPRAVTLIAALLQDDARHDAAQAMYARREGLRIPEGGFVGEKGEILTRDEWNRRRNGEEIAKLRASQERLLKRLRDTTLVKGIEKMASLRADLDRRRAFALELIFDEVKYFYPYRDRMKEYTPVQTEVDRRVAAVRELWEGKEKFRAKVDGTAAQVLKEFDAAAERMRALGGEPGTAEAEVDALRRYFDRELTPGTFPVNEEEAAAWAQDDAVMKENATRKTEAADPEREQVRITNDYRRMFNRRALVMNDVLVKSSRAHGDDMSRGGFFSHFNEILRDPTKKCGPQACGCSADRLQPGCSHGPDARMAHAGYEFFGCSENIHMGSGDPLGAHSGWIHSSGHHRNILMKDWKEMGTGQVGRYWTQNFGIPVLPDAGGAGADHWSNAGGRGEGGDGNDPRDGR